MMGSQRLSDTLGLRLEADGRDFNSDGNSQNQPVVPVENDGVDPKEWEYLLSEKNVMLEYRHQTTARNCESVLQGKDHKAYENYLRANQAQLYPRTEYSFDLGSDRKHLCVMSFASRHRELDPKQFQPKEGEAECKINALISILNRFNGVINARYGLEDIASQDRGRVKPIERKSYLHGEWLLHNADPIGPFAKHQRIIIKKSESDDYPFHICDANSAKVLANAALGKDGKLNCFALNGTGPAVQHGIFRSIVKPVLTLDLETEDLEADKKSADFAIDASQKLDKSVRAAFVHLQIMQGIDPAIFALLFNWPKSHIDSTDYERLKFRLYHYLMRNKVVLETLYEDLKHIPADAKSEINTDTSPQISPAALLGGFAARRRLSAEKKALELSAKNLFPDVPSKESKVLGV